MRGGGGGGAAFSEVDVQIVPLTSMGTKENPVDIAIVGCGPAGVGAADIASARGLKGARRDFPQTGER